MKKIQSEYDKAAKKGLIKKNTASRRKAAAVKIAKKAGIKPAKAAAKPAAKPAAKKPAAKPAAKKPAAKPAAKEVKEAEEEKAPSRDKKVTPKKLSRKSDDAE